MLRPVFLRMILGGFTALIVLAAERHAAAQLLRAAGFEFEPILIAAEGSAGLALAKESRALAAQGELEAALAKAEQALPLLRAEFGDRHANTGFIMDDLATLNFRLGRLDEALAYAEQAVPIVAAARDQKSSDYAVVVNNQATILSALGRFDEAMPLYESAHAIFLAKLGLAHDRTAGTARNLGIHYSEMGDLEKAQVYFDQALEAVRALHGVSSLEFAHALLDRAGVDLKLEAVAKARAAAEQARAVVAAQDPVPVPDLAQAEVTLARADIQESRLGEARTRLEQMLDRLERAGIADNESAAAVFYNLGVIQLLEGQTVEAEATYRHVLELYRRQFGERHPAVARTLHSLAILYGNLGLAAKAQELFRQAIAVFERSFGPNDPSLAATRLELGLLLSDLGKSKEAIEEAQAALKIYDQIKGPWAIKRAYATSVLGFALHAAGRREEAAAHFERALAMMEEVRGPDSADLPPGLVELALIRMEQGRYEEAESLARRAVEIREKDEALTPWGVAKAKSVLAQAIGEQGRSLEALELIGQATQIMRDRINIGDRQTTFALHEVRSEREVFERHLAIGYPLFGKGNGALVAELFEVIQLPHMTATAAAVSRMATRFARGNDKLARVLWEREQAVDRLAATQARLRDVLASESRLGPVDVLRADIDRLDTQVRELDDQIAQDSPRFGELLRPSPISLAEIRGAEWLEQGEAVLVQVTTPNGTFLALADHTSVRFEHTDLETPELTERVARLRAGLETGLNPYTCVSRNFLDLQPFDVESAYRLYATIFASFKGELADIKTLFFVPDGAMQNITPSVLIRRPAEEAPPAYGQFQSGKLSALNVFRELDFLGLSIPIAVLPSLDALVRLREAEGLGRGQGFVGIAPFAHKPEPQDPGRCARDLDDRRDAFSSLAELSNTDEHITSLADLFSVDSRFLLFNLDSTKSALKDPRVERAQVIAFATHGLIANEVKTLAEPALVLHPDGDDGLLLGSEIGELPLSAEWIILSACNTAAPQGETGAEGLSGLARAFFFAGSRSLLVSHWWIEAGSADFLARRTLEIWRGDRSIGKAEALRRAMNERAEGLLTHSHPYYWAGFSVVGG